MGARPAGLGAGRGIKKSIGRGSASAIGGRGRGATKGHLKKPFPVSQNGIGQKPLGNVRMLDTNRVVREVRRHVLKKN